MHTPQYQRPDTHIFRDRETDKPTPIEGVKIKSDETPEGPRRCVYWRFGNIRKILSKIAGGGASGGRGGHTSSDTHLQTHILRHTPNIP